jgi:hypothetical protein
VAARVCARRELAQEACLSDAGLPDELDRSGGARVEVGEHAIE